MKKHNYVVDLTNFQNNVAHSLMNALAGQARVNQWKQLSFDPLKNLFRFKLITDPKDISNNNGGNYVPGFYYWTSNSMIDADVTYLNVDEAITLLKNIDKTEHESVIVEGHFLDKVNATTFKISCRQIRVNDFITLYDIFRKYDMEELSIITNGDKIVFDEEDFKKIRKFLVDKKLIKK